MNLNYHLSDETFISKDFNIPQHYKELDVEKFIYPRSTDKIKIQLE